MPRRTSKRLTMILTQIKENILKGDTDVSSRDKNFAQVLSIYNSSFMVESNVNLFTKTCKLANGFEATMMHCTLYEIIQEKDVNKLNMVAQWITDPPLVNFNPIAKPTCLPNLSSHCQSSSTIHAKKMRMN